MSGAGSPAEAFSAVWNPGQHAIEGLIELTDPDADPGFAAAAASVVAWLEGDGFFYPARWVQEEAAARLSRQPPVAPVTDDFVGYVFEEGAELVPSLRFTAPPDVQRVLERKQLLVDDPDALEGGFRWGDGA